VQWHPELLPDLAEHRRLFAWLVDQAAAGRPVPSISSP
jgi:gamma-glutamyl-gamma-aminobutyrate hydrolase PuuD